MDARFKQLKGKIASVEAKDTALQGKINTKYTELQGKIDGEQEELKKNLSFAIPNYSTLVKGKPARNSNQNIINNVKL